MCVSLINKNKLTTVSSDLRPQKILARKLKIFEDSKTRAKYLVKYFYLPVGSPPFRFGKLEILTIQTQTELDITKVENEHLCS